MRDPPSYLIALRRFRTLRTARQTELEPRGGSVTVSKAVLPLNGRSRLGRSVGACKVLPAARGIRGVRGGGFFHIPRRSQPLACDARGGRRFLSPPAPRHAARSAAAECRVRSASGTPHGHAVPAMGRSAARIGRSLAARPRPIRPPEDRWTPKSA